MITRFHVVDFNDLAIDSHVGWAIGLPNIPSVNAAGKRDISCRLANGGRMLPFPAYSAGSG